MSYTSEHQRLRPVLEKARRLDIASHPAPNSIFEAGNAGFQIWCTLEDHPKGWDDVEMDAGAFSKPCDYVGSVRWGWTEDRITHLVLTTDAYGVQDHDRDRGRDTAEYFDWWSKYHNRPDDVEWAAVKTAWLFSLARVACPPIKVSDDDETAPPIRPSKASEGNLPCPQCGGSLRITDVYFQDEHRRLLLCENWGSCNFREL